MLNNLIMDLQQTNTTAVAARSKFSSPVEIKDLSPLSSVAVPPFYENNLECVVIPNGTLLSRIENIASEIANFYQERPYVVIVVLKGAFVVAKDLFNALQDIYVKGSYLNGVLFEYIRLKSYADENSTGKVEAVGLDMLDLADKEVLIVEDIVDTGVTMKYLLENVYKKNPKSVKIFSLLLKESRLKFEFPIDFIGFVIPDKFVVGYGLDYNEYFRDLKHICILNQEGKQKFSTSALALKKSAL